MSIKVMVSNLPVKVPFFRSFMLYSVYNIINMKKFLIKIIEQKKIISKVNN